MSFILIKHLKTEDNMSNNQLDFNRLGKENSQYLKQHKLNPVNWWAWGPEAILKAKSENKPIFISVGYSSCHWCHVMSHESFDDTEVAKVLNENFISIKVDKEEFPDIDNYYQKAAQLFVKTGGWPLSAFLLPDLRPFFAGTYFPKKSSDKQIGFLDLITELSRAYREDYEQVLKNAEQVTHSIQNWNNNKEKIQFEGHFPNANAIMDAVKNFQDTTNGGFGTPPKFPNFSFLEWAIEQMLEGMISKENGEFIIKTSERILMGGINDHARGGIHRYSADEKWLVPHFEKMLYDQAGFIKFLTKLSLIYPVPLVYDSLINTISYLDDEMLLINEDSKVNSYFFAAQDADSEGVEGLYFTFTYSEFEDMLNKHDNDDELLEKNKEKILKWFQVTDIGNFENNLNLISLNPEFKSDYLVQESWDIIRIVRKAILNERKDRIPPQTDSKGIASWNFLVISALVDVLQYCQIGVIKKMASNLINKSIDGIFQTFITQETNGMKLRHTTTNETSLPYLEDFVFFAEAQLRLYEISGNENFKNNFKETLNFIQKEFISNDIMLTRANFANNFELYPNQDYSFFDNSFKSAVSTFINISRRACVLFADKDFLLPLTDLVENVTHTTLKINPINSGEALRGLIYPDEAYRVIKVPKTWVQDERFINILPYFLSRFVIDYTSELNVWQICNINSCELKGEGIEEFVQVLTPQSGQDNT